MFLPALVVYMSQASHIVARKCFLLLSRKNTALWYTSSFTSLYSVPLHSGLHETPNLAQVHVCTCRVCELYRFLTLVRLLPCLDTVWKQATGRQTASKPVIISHSHHLLVLFLAHGHACVLSLQSLFPHSCSSSYHQQVVSWSIHGHAPETAWLAHSCYLTFWQTSRDGALNPTLHLVSPNWEW